jgi:hypothetical protein
MVKTYWALPGEFGGDRVTPDKWWSLMVTVLKEGDIVPGSVGIYETLATRASGFKYIEAQQLLAVDWMLHGVDIEVRADGQFKRIILRPPPRGWDDDPLEIP